MYEQGHRRAEAEMKEAAQAMESQDIGQIRRDYEEARRDGRQFIGNLEHIGALLIKVEQLIAVANLAQELVSRVREKEMLPESDAEIVGELEDAISRAI